MDKFLIRKGGASAGGSSGAGAAASQLLASAAVRKSHPAGLRLFIDLDGVLADFDTAARALLGRSPDDVPPGVMWAAIRNAPDFFGTLAEMHDARVLWEFVQPYAPTILTGSPRGEAAHALRLEKQRPDNATSEARAPRRMTAAVAAPSDACTKTRGQRHL
jgi:hypothetical protein